MASRADAELEERRVETAAAPPRDNPTEVSLQMTLAKPAKLAKEDKQDQTWTCSRLRGRWQQLGIERNPDRPVLLSDPFSL